MIAALLVLAAALAPAKPQAEIRNVRISSPKILISREKSDSEVKVSGQFKVEMYASKNAVKKPVVRLVCLCEANGALRLCCTLLDRPNTAKCMGLSEFESALRKAGIKVDYKEREKQCMDLGTCTPYLAEVSREAYASATYGTSELKEGFFRLGKSEKMPKLLLFRIEVWQNGALAAKHESSHAGLGSYALPKDWYAWKKYPDKFKYADVR